jgi:4-hydroxy-tetrahydrodipicolinate reductase
MGQVIENCIAERDDCQIVAGFDIKAEPERAYPVYTDFSACTEKADVIIDFSHPASLDGLLDYALAHKMPLIIATTGYTPEQTEKIQAAAKQIPVFFSFNMSLGVNLLAELAKKAAAFLGDQFDIEIIEKHHNRKLDAPSGTALMLADEINTVLNEPHSYMYDRHSVRRKRDKNEIGISSVRGGTIVGEHEIIFAGRDEIIELKHTAMSREIFAVGAVNAAVYMADQLLPRIYTMSDLL